jgi:hypothetical protein
MCVPRPPVRAANSLTWRQRRDHRTSAFCPTKKSELTMLVHDKGWSRAHYRA